MSFHVIGSEEVVLGFRFAGVPGSIVQTAEEAREAFRAVTAAGTTLVLVLTEQAAALIPDEVTGWQLGGRYPLLVEIPGLEGHRPGRRSLIDSIREAVGIHV